MKKKGGGSFGTDTGQVWTALTVWPNVHSDDRQTTGVSDVRSESEITARGLGKLEPAPARKIKNKLYDARPVGQNQRFARLKVAALEHD